jgi:DHA2 family lincomycin resistance protein-like MFS transporter
MKHEEKLKPKLLVSVLSVSLLILCGLLTETATNIAFPTLMEEYGVTASSVQWLTTGKMLVVAMITPLSAFFKKRFVTKNVFIFSNIIFLIGCLIGTFTLSFNILIVAAIIQGLGIGIVLPMVFNIILEQVPSSKTGTMMGIASLIMAAGPALGPTFGGIVVTALGWRAIFSLMIPLTILSLIGGCITIEQKTSPSKIKLDIIGTLLVMLGFFLLVYGITALESFSKNSLKIVLYLVLGVLTLIMFCLHAKRKKDPLIHLNVFKSSVFNWHLISYIFMQIVFLGFSFVLSNYLQVVCGESAFITGLCLLPGAMGQAILSICSGVILDKYGAMKPIYFGSILAIIGCSLFFIAETYIDAIMVVVFYIIMEVGLGCTYGNTMTHALQNISQKDNSDGNAVFNTFGQLAGSLGTSISAVILTVFQQNPVYPSLTFATAEGIHWIFMIFIMLLLLNFIFQIAAFHKASVK